MTFSTNPIKSDQDDFVFAAKMTDRQFRAISQHIKNANTLNELIEKKRIVKPRKSVSCNESELKKWLINAWNTEYILSYNSTILENANGAALQWTFPQAYYAVFASTLAFFQVSGFTESSHSAVKHKFAKLALKDTYPSSINFTADGTKKNMAFYGLKPHDREVSSIHFNHNNPKSCDRQIQQFLKSTREIDLDKRKKDNLNLRTKSGSIRKSYKEKHWKTVSSKVGPTGLLCLLYRKRIKSNYREIDTFTASSLNPIPIFNALTEIVKEIAQVNESYIAAAIGIDDYLKISDKYLDNNGFEILEQRIKNVKKVVNS
jgi:uncharacterized protein (UPF0332 family)